MQRTPFAGRTLLAGGDRENAAGALLGAERNDGQGTIPVSLQPLGSTWRLSPGEIRRRRFVPFQGFSQEGVIAFEVGVLIGRKSELEAEHQVR